MLSRPSTDLPLAALSLAVLLVAAGCLGSASAPFATTDAPMDDAATAASSSTPTTTTESTATTTETPCSPDTD
ncbi:hypothetical protein [Halorussus caseinilyticus]|uniref:Uncharacterized protein n=1 Tax=Halorussus caseinilyticus TaxID=3034025 RepID=A0ABD5WJG4_9EURY|nr:hypothetical protein [Halorussus sp. DT72]